MKLVDDASKLGMSSEDAVNAAREHLPELKIEDDAKSSLRDALPTATQATLTEHQLHLEKLGLRDSEEYKQAERKKQQLEEARDALASWGRLCRLPPSHATCPRSCWPCENAVN